MDRYADVFNVRGHKYDAAMRAYPTARDEEFRQLFKGVDTGPLKRVFDLPSGGGYLHRFIAADAQLVQFDPSAGFATQGVLPVDLENPELPTPGADLIVSLAALHHVANKTGFLEASLAALKPGGWLCIGDVAAGSDIARFLDQFVGMHNGMGHSGDYLDPYSSEFQKVAQPQATLVRCDVAPCPWRFADTDDLAGFCRSLFGLLAVDDESLLKALDAQVGIATDAAGVSLEWELLYLQYRKQIDA